jgi:hypothetical protein
VSACKLSGPRDNRHELKKKNKLTELGMDCMGRTIGQTPCESI